MRLLPCNLINCEVFYVVGTTFHKLHKSGVYSIRNSVDQNQRGHLHSRRSCTETDSCKTYDCLGSGIALAPKDHRIKTWPFIYFARACCHPAYPRRLTRRKKERARHSLSLLCRPYLDRRRVLLPLCIRDSSRSSYRQCDYSFVRTIFGASPSRQPTL